MPIYSLHYSPVNAFQSLIELSLLPLAIVLSTFNKQETARVCPFIVLIHSPVNESHILIEVSSLPLAKILIFLRDEFTSMVLNSIRVRYIYN